MRRIKSAEGEYYHIFNRGVNKEVIFHDLGDYTRFLFLVLHFQNSEKVGHLSRAVKKFSRTFGQHPVLATSVGYDVGDRSEVKGGVEKGRMVELVSFCIMPNHFHLLVKEMGEAGIASYMQRVLNAYGKYYNTKYGKSGHVFQGPYKVVHIENDLQLMHLSAYIHRNPRDISEWVDKEDRYPWSSYHDYVRNNRWNNLLAMGIILDRFSKREEYEEFVRTSPTKEKSG